MRRIDSLSPLVVAFALGAAVLAGCSDDPVADDPAPCTEVDCGANGFCEELAEGGGTCLCDAGYEREGGACIDTDECAAGTDDCPGAAVCENTDGGFTCVCGDGFVFDGDACADVDECAEGTDDCTAEQTCENTNGGFECACPMGLAGDDCTDVDECALELDDCDDATTRCENTVGSFTCECLPGYALDEEGACTDIDECLVTACGTNFVCENTPGSFACVCAAGYAPGPDDTCVNVDECAGAAPVCDPLSEVCTDTDGSYTCDCAAGFEPLGDACADIDECTDGTAGCADDATCTNLPGAFECACDSGFEGDGFTCTDIDECAADLCPDASICENGIGTVTCTCTAGWSGDGDTCARGDVLIYTDQPRSAFEWATTEAGLAPTLVGDAAMFESMIARPEGWEVVVVETGTLSVTPRVVTALDTWIGDGGRAIYAAPNLASDTDAQDTLGVTAVAIDDGSDIVAIDDGYLDLFDQRYRLAVPLTGVARDGNDGAALTPVDSGFTVATFGTDGPGAIAVTHDGAVIVLGYLPSASTADSDADGSRDARELMVNQLDYLVGRRVLLFASGPEDPLTPEPDPPQSELDDAAVALGWSVYRTEGLNSGDDVALSDALAIVPGVDLIAVDSPKLAIANVEAELVDWVTAGGSLLLSEWSTHARTDLLSLLGMTASRYVPFQALFDTPGPSGESLFDAVETFPSPFDGTPVSSVVFKGHTLTVPATGWLIGALGAEDGDGAVAVVEEGRVMISGFMPSILPGVDADEDGVPDARELWTNMLAWIAFD